MDMRNIGSLEVVVRRFDPRAFDDRKADGEEDVFDLLKDLPNQMMRANGADDSRKREVNAFARTGGFVSAFFDCFKALFDLGLNMSPKFVEGSTDDPLKVRSGRFQPIVCDLRQHPRLAAHPRLAELFPARFIPGG